MKISRTKIIWLLVAVVAVGGIVFAVTRKPKVTYETEKIVRGQVIEQVSVTGSLAPVKKIDLQPEVSGKVVSLNVDSGSVVKAGDVLVVLDSRDVQSQIVSQRAAVDAAKAHLAELSAGATAQDLAVSQAAVDTATTKLASAVAAKADAQTALANANATADSQTTSKLQTVLLDYDKAVVDAKNAIYNLTGPMFTTDNFLTFSTTSAIDETNARNSRALAKDKTTELSATIDAVNADDTVKAVLDAYGTVAADLNIVKSNLNDDSNVLNYSSGLSSDTIAQYKANVSTALTTISATIQLVNDDQSNLDLQNRTNQTQIDGAQAALTASTYAISNAQNALDQAKADLTLKQTGSRPEVIAAQRAQVEVAQAALSGLQTDLSKRSIVSPIDGVVTDVPVEIGETVGPSTLAVSLQTKGSYQITTNVSEIDVGKVAVGDPVAITLDAFPKTQTWTGKVTKIDPAETVVEGVIFYQTTVVFDNDDPRLRSGMTANLAIQTNKKDDVLRVPLRALHDSGTKTTVSVLVNGVQQDVDVTTGLEDNTHAEAVTGLKEGDVVVLSVTKK